MRDTGFLSGWPAWTRWVAVLPAALLGAAAGWLFSLVALLFSDSEGARLTSIAAQLFIAMFFVTAGTAMAPVGRRGKITVATALAVLDVVVALSFTVRLGFAENWLIALVSAVGAIAALIFVIRPDALET